MNAPARHQVHFFSPSGSALLPCLATANTLAPLICEHVGQAPEIWCESVHAEGKRKLVVEFRDPDNRDNDLILCVYIARTAQVILKRRSAPEAPFEVVCEGDPHNMEIHVDVASDIEALCFFTQLALSLKSTSPLGLDLALEVRPDVLQ
jgi:hypothetical protein